MDIPGTWNGLTIRYYESIVTFDIGGHGCRTGGGELVQTVEDQTAAVAPEVIADDGWVFLGWDADFSCVTSNMTVNALWRRVYSLGEALAADEASAALTWTVGTNGVAVAKGYDDPTATGGKSVKFTADDEAMAWVEAVVTNACRVSFDWKCSCEPLVKGRPYDFLAFEVDGERTAFICGETDWTNVAFHVTGEGEHVLRWTFQRDEDGASGEDSAWLANVSVVPSVTVAFADGGATAGSVPEPITAYADESIVLPEQGTLAWAKHTFLGWGDGNAVYGPGDPYPCDGASLLTAQWAAKTLSAPAIEVPTTYEADSVTVTITADAGAAIFYTLDGSMPDPARPEAAPYLGPFEVAGSATIRAIAVRDDYFDSEVATATVTRLAWTFGEYLNLPEQTFTTGGDAAWTRAKSVSADGYALRSGAVTHCQTSRLETVVSGPGTVSFSCKVSGEIVKRIVFDGLAFCVDGVQQGNLMGNADWEVKTFEIAGAGPHTLSWLYVKDEDGTVGDDCAWLDTVTWMPILIPPLAPDATPVSVTNAIEAAGFVDVDAVMVTIGGNVAEYNAFKTWAAGIAGGEPAVIASSHAAASYLLGVAELFDNEPTVEITEVAIGDSPSSESDGFMTLSVTVKDGGRAVTVDPAKVAAMFEATSDLGDWNGAAKLTPTVEVLEGDGATMRFRVTPGDGTASSAFLRIKK